MGGRGRPSLSARRDLPIDTNRGLPYIFGQTKLTNLANMTAGGVSCRVPSNELMKVALFIPCFIDAFYPEVGIATLELLERFGIEVDYPQEQTCCGQPMANSGAHADAAGAERVFARNFAGYDYIVGPSASCIHHVREHLTAIEQTDEVRNVRAGAYELVEFLHDVVGAREFPWAEFPYRVGLHNSCSALRHLKEASVSEVA